MKSSCQCCRHQTVAMEVPLCLSAHADVHAPAWAWHMPSLADVPSAFTVVDYQFTNSEGCIFNKLVFLNW